LIVDASVAIKWVIGENDSEAAIALVGREILIAPDLIASEVANGVWNKWRKGEIAGVPDTFRNFAALLRIEPSAPLAFRAAKIAIELNHPAYDCVYLALAERLDDRIITADQRFILKCAGTSYAARVVPFD